MTVQYVWVIATSLVLFTLVANVAVVQYARAVTRSALDDGVRAGARVTTSADAAELACERAAEATRRDLLGGRLGDGITVDCTPGAGEMRAEASSRFASWFPAVPDWTFTDRAVAVQEVAP
ncbi:MAG: hypothetical protein KY461_09985 [Actinobacteria bacterium]|nr:hypothetical protein [Actinomycetota bacterium]